MLTLLAALALGQTPAPAQPENLVYKLKNTAAADVAAAIKKSASGAPFVVTPEPITNTLLISGTAADVVRIVEQVNKLDAPVPQYMIDFRVCSGDPLGSRAAGTLKELSAGGMTISEGLVSVNRGVGEVNVDGELVPVGAEMKATVLSMKGELIRVRLEGAYTTVEGPEKARSLKTVRSITTREVKAGEMTRFRIGQPADAVWAEATVRPVQQMPNYQVPPVRPQPGK